MPFLIDGYNLVRMVEGLNPEYPPLTDIEICRMVSRFMAIKKEKAQIIFDGIGPPEKTAFFNLRYVKVIFSGQTTEADTVIEEKIQASTAPKRLTIVSSDRRVINAAKSRKATSLKSFEFWLELLKVLSKKKKIKEPIQKLKGLTESETAHWMRIFGLDDQDQQ